MTKVKVILESTAKAIKSNQKKSNLIKERNIIYQSFFDEH